MSFQVTHAHTKQPIHVNAATVASVYSDEYRNNHGGRHGAYVRDDVTRIMHVHGVVHAVDESIEWVMEQVRSMLKRPQQAAAQRRIVDMQLSVPQNFKDLDRDVFAQITPEMRRDHANQILIADVQTAKILHFKKDVNEPWPESTINVMVVSYQMPSADSLADPTPINASPPHKEPIDGHVTDRHDG